MPPFVRAGRFLLASALVAACDGKANDPPTALDAGMASTDSGAPPAAAPGLTARSAANVLFSGHSLLDNPIPDYVAAIAAAKGDSLGWEEQIINGSPIRVRTRGNDPGAVGYPGYASGKNRAGDHRDLLAELKAPTQLSPGQKYDTLLITERYNPLDTAQWEDSVGYLRHYHDRIVAASPSARTLFYQCWPDIDKDAPEAWIRYQQVELTVWECIGAKVRLSLAAEGKPQNLGVVPGAVALAQLVEKAVAGQVPGLEGTQRARLDQIFSDNVHLATAGQYLIAAVHYASIFGKSPVGAHAVPALSSATADAIERIAWESVQRYAASGTGPARSMEDCRTRIAAEVCASYYAVRGESVPAQGCDFWRSAQSPFNFPDAKLPLPAP
jgi:hypothetical protein